jgi:hypothetical protein
MRAWFSKRFSKWTPPHFRRAGGLQRDMAALKVQGSPTILLNNCRQTLYGNIGYRIIEANIGELLYSPAAGSAGWC